MARKSIPQAFTRKLLAWYARAARDLPWRRTRDPYRVAVSEFMLQQTQVSRVLEYYPRFLKRFPTLRHLARARPKAVREAWEGLGYYARASSLHALSRVVSKTYDGVIPETPEELQELPGVGPYTAGAIATFAYEKPVAAVDTNVARVITRVFGNAERGMRNAEQWRLASRLVPKDGKKAWRFNQALMELGAVICRARKPRCLKCPVQQLCKTGASIAAPSPLSTPRSPAPPQSTHSQSVSS
jgi:A/G-specific adenine glycosylase